MVTFVAPASIALSTNSEMAAGVPRYPASLIASINVASAMICPLIFHPKRGRPGWPGRPPARPLRCGFSRGLRFRLRAVLRVGGRRPPVEQLQIRVEALCPLCTLDEVEHLAVPLRLQLAETDHEQHQFQRCLHARWRVRVVVHVGVEAVTGVEEELLLTADLLDAVELPAVRLGHALIRLLRALGLDLGLRRLGRRSLRLRTLLRFTLERRLALLFLLYARLRFPREELRRLANDLFGQLRRVLVLFCGLVVVVLAIPLAELRDGLEEPVLLQQLEHPLRQRDLLLVGGDAELLVERRLELNLAGPVTVVVYRVVGRATDTSADVAQDVDLPAGTKDHEARIVLADLHART